MGPDGRATPGPPPATPGARPPARGGPGRARGPGARARVPAWGWLELFVLSQTFLPALLFVPGLSAGRTPIRIAAYAIAPVAWSFLARRGSRRPGSDSFPARPWLLASAAWVGLSVLHPNSYSIVA